MKNSTKNKLLYILIYIIKFFFVFSPGDGDMKIKQL